MWHARLPRLLPAAVAVVALGACAGSSEADARTVAEEMLAAAGRGDGGAACALLSEKTRDELEAAAGAACEQAVLEQDLTPEQAVAVAVFDTSAQVRFPSSAVFLARFDSGWRVVAAACEPVRDRPYDCSVEGG